MDEKFIRERITQLRVRKGVSEYKMSYALGHSRGYINNITSGKSLPSMNEFLAICEYFQISPAEFFDESNHKPDVHRQIVNGTDRLSEEDFRLVMQFIQRLLE